MCGYYGDSKRQCRCTSRQIETYRQRISGPLLDRIDLHVDVPLVDYRELSSTSNGGESSATIRERVQGARAVQLRRFKNKSTQTNSAMGARLVREHCKLDGVGAGYLEQAMEQMNFSARPPRRQRPHPPGRRAGAIQSALYPHLSGGSLFFAPAGAERDSPSFKRSVAGDANRSLASPSCR
ncbi:ATP-binding protein [Luteolibacter sp. LG18]|uniref:magnesium chelatase subunit ChlI family protein n=1 Tax=Luteolibacter sp. LG18 TaxID=2819286 RepID=UPI002B2F49BA|nr:hypothetical protein llg_23620 [Luteolibacter sp. LG18]